MNWATNELINWLINTEGLEHEALKIMLDSDNPSNAASDILSLVPEHTFFEYDPDGFILGDHTADISWWDVKAYLVQSYKEDNNITADSALDHYMNLMGFEDEMVYFFNRALAVFNVDPIECKIWEFPRDTAYVAIDPHMTVDGFGSGGWELLEWDQSDYDAAIKQQEDDNTTARNEAIKELIAESGLTDTDNDLFDTLSGIAADDDLDYEDLSSIETIIDMIVEFADTDRLTEWFVDNLANYAKDIAGHGADSGFPHITYVSDCVKLYDRFEDEIEPAMTEWAERFEYDNNFAFACSFQRSDMLTSVDGYKNLAVWFAIEEIAYQYTNLFE